jgi:hypothetical protein
MFMMYPLDQPCNSARPLSRAEIIAKIKAHDRNFINLHGDDGALAETQEILADKNAMAAIKEGMDDLDSGDVYPL